MRNWNKENNCMEGWKVVKYWFSNFVTNSFKEKKSVTIEKVSICWGSSRPSFQDWNLSFTFPDIYILIDWYRSVSMISNIQPDLWGVKSWRPNPNASNLQHTELLIIKHMLFSHVVKDFANLTEIIAAHLPTYSVTWSSELSGVAGIQKHCYFFA